MPFFLPPNDLRNRLKQLLLFASFLFIATLIMTQPKKTIPKNIKNEVELALMHFPELKDIPIEFKFKKNIKKSVMQAQPTFTGVFNSRKNRSYKVLISEKFKITGEEFKTVDMPSEVLVGWIGHELGHIMDYQERSGFNLLGFGIKYVLFKEYVKKAERAADSFAVGRGMSDYILKTKRFILDNSEINPTYKERIKQYYLSPDEIMEMVEKQDTAKGD